jgi:hypothetical protein
MIDRSIGALRGALLFVAVLIVVTIILSAAQLLALTPPVPSPIAGLAARPDLDSLF